MIDLIFATHNNHKLEEVQQMLPNLHLKSLSDTRFNQEIVEDGDSFRANAEIKVDTISNFTEQSVFADDSGLVIPALDGAPGIYSARYAGSGNSKDNIAKVLNKMKGKKERSAYFICVICLKHAGEKYFFEGKVEGVILEDVAGDCGFGYDPIFKPDGYTVSFAELSAEEKNEISHRGKAIREMQNYLYEKFKI